MDAKVHWCCCVDQPGLIPDNVQFVLSSAVPQMEGTYLCLRWIGTQLVKFVIGSVSTCSVLMRVLSRRCGSIFLGMLYTGHLELRVSGCI